MGVRSEFPGATTPLEAEPGHVRGDLALASGRSLIHGPDIHDAAAFEIGLRLQSNCSATGSPAKPVWRVEGSISPAFPWPSPTFAATLWWSCWFGVTHLALLTITANEQQVVDGHRTRLVSLFAGLAASASLLGLTAVQAAVPVPRVVEVPFRPAFVRSPAGAERPARAGQILVPDSLLRTTKPGRLQVQLANGRHFRLGGDAVLRLGRSDLNLEKGQIIAWVNPGQKGGSPLRIHTRIATASIVGTTVFIEATDDSFKVFSWEGRVQLQTEAGRRYVLHSGQQLSFEKETWQPLQRLSQSEAADRRRKSLLLNGFSTPMETLPVIEKELDLVAAPAAPAASATP